MRLEVENISFSYESARVLKDVSFNVRSGEFLGIIGPNGSGKTTLLRCMSNVLKPQVGTVLLDERTIRKMTRREISRRVAVVPQKSSIDFDFTVADMVLMGRTPHLSRFSTESRHDLEIAETAMRATNTYVLRDRLFDELSGGEQQRVIIARALAQEPKVLLLDEPTAHLDVSCQLDVLDLVRELGKSRGITILSVFHDLNLASQYSDRLILLKEGRIFSVGKPNDVLAPKSIKAVFGINMLVKRHPFANTVYVTPYTAKRRRASSAGFTVHVICGGGSGSDVMNCLLDEGFNVQAGVLNVLDTDYETAVSLNIPVVSELPFSHIADSSHMSNLSLLKRADALLVTDFPVGPGNLKNLEAVGFASENGIPVVIIDESSMERKDFTQGELRECFSRLKARKDVRFVKSVGEALQALERFKNNRG